MNLLKRATLSIKRRATKSLLILLVVLVVSTLLLSTDAITDASKKQRDELLGSKEVGFSIKTSLMSASGQGLIPEDVIKKIASNKKIHSYNKRTMVAANLIGVKPLYLEGENPFDEETRRLYGDILNVTADLESKYETSFRTGLLTLKEGRHLEAKDKNKVLVHEDFARLNHLEVGSKFSLKGNLLDPDNIYQSEKEVEVQVLGIFSGKNSQMPMTNQEMFENLLYTDLTTAGEIYGVSPEKMHYHDGMFFTTEDKLDPLLKELKELGLNPNEYQLIKNTELTAGLTESIEHIHELITKIKRMTILLGFIILSIILTIWIHERKKEIGILLSIGKSKVTIAVQMLLEIFIISLIAICLSYFSSKGLAQLLSD